MAAYDNAGSVEGVGVSSVSFAFTTSGTNRAIVGSVHVEDDPTAASVSTITYGGVSLGAERAGVLNPNYTRVQMFALANPASGSNTLAVTLNNAATYGVTLGAISATAVDQTTPVRAGSATSAFGDTASPTISVSSAVDDLVVDAISLGQSNTPGVAPTAGAGQTRRYNQEQNYIAAAGSTEAGAASVTMSWTTTGAGSPEWALAGLSLANAAAGNDQIAGEAALAFTNSGTLTGTGALAGSAAQAFSNSGTLAGTGELAGSAAQAFVSSGTLTGSGELAGTAAQVFSNSATLTGSGSLAGQAQQAFSNTGTLTGTGALAGTAALAFDNTGTLTQPGGISGVASLAFSNSGTLTAMGALAGESALLITPTGTLRNASAQEVFSGGFFYAYESALIRRRREEREREEAEEQAQQLQDAIDREIALLLRKQEAEEAQARELERLKALVTRFQATAIDSERVQRAFSRALTQQNVSAYLALDRELRRMLEEEEFMILMVLAND